MKAYGIRDKRGPKLHPANECAACSEKKPPSKKRERNKVREQIQEEISSDGGTGRH